AAKEPEKFAPLHGASETNTGPGASRNYHIRAARDELMTVGEVRFGSPRPEMGNLQAVSAKGLGRVKTPFPRQSVRSHDRLGLRPRSHPSTAWSRRYL